MGPFPKKLRFIPTRSRTTVCMSEGFTDQERLTSYYEKFGDPCSYHLRVGDPQAYDLVRLPPPPSGSYFTESELGEFIDFMSTNNIKLKFWFRRGQIIITELDVHGGHQSVVNYFVETVGAYDTANAPGVAQILKGAGQRTCRFPTTTTHPDGQWIPFGGLTPSLYLEVGNCQPIGALLERVNTVLNDSRDSRYVIIVKIWRNPRPTQSAMVIAVWRKMGDFVQDAEYEAVHFVSFGPRAPTDEELAAFPVEAGAGAWVPDLVGVVEDAATTIPANVANMGQAVYNINLHAASLFSLPDTPAGAEPGGFSGLGDLTLSLVRLQFRVTDLMKDDILLELYRPTAAEFQDIVDDPAMQLAPYEDLYQYALQRLAV